MTTIWDLTGPNGGPRFYPPGQHPATYRERTILRRIEDLGLGASEEAARLRERLAAFEESESVRKADCDRMLRERRAS